MNNYVKNLKHDIEILLHAILNTVRPEPQGWFKMITTEGCQALKTDLSDIQKEWGQSIDYLIINDSYISSDKLGGLFNFSSSWPASQRDSL